MNKIIEDFKQMKPRDLLEYRCPSTGIVTQWRVQAIELGALHEESLIAVTTITNKPAKGNSLMMVPEKMTRHLTIIRGEES